MVGIIAPQWLKYVERSKRVTDVTNAREIHDTYERIAAIDNPGTIGGLGVPTGGMWWKEDAIMPTTPANIMDAAFMEMGKIPASATNKDYFFGVEYDDATGSIEKIYLCPAKPSGAPNISTQYQLWPDPSDFLENGLN